MATPEPVNRFGAGRASTGGVKNLLAMFEQGGSKSSSPATTPTRPPIVTSSSGSFNRVKTKLVAVKLEDGRMGVQEQKESGSPVGEATPADGTPPWSRAALKPVAEKSEEKPVLKEVEKPVLKEVEKPVLKEVEKPARPVVEEKKPKLEPPKEAPKPAEKPVAREPVAPKVEKKMQPPKEKALERPQPRKQDTREHVQPKTEPKILETKVEPKKPETKVEPKPKVTPARVESSKSLAAPKEEKAKSATSSRPTRKTLTVPTNSTYRGPSPIRTPRSPMRSPALRAKEPVAEKPREKPKEKRPASPTKPRHSVAPATSSTRSTPKPRAPSTGFAKPEPKEATKPLSLYGSAFAPTAAWIAKHGGEPPAKQPAHHPLPRSRSPVRGLRRQTSSISDHSTQQKSDVRSPTRRPATSAAHRSTRQNAAPTAETVHHSPPPPREVLDRLMRPTQSSASKVNERKEHPATNFQPALRAGSAIGDRNSLSPQRKTSVRGSHPHVPRVRLSSYDSQATPKSPRSDVSEISARSNDEPKAESLKGDIAEDAEADNARIKQEVEKGENRTSIHSIPPVEFADQQLPAKELAIEIASSDNDAGVKDEMPIDDGIQTPTTTTSSSTLVHDGGDEHIQSLEDVVKQGLDE